MNARAIESGLGTEDRDLRDHAIKRFEDDELGRGPFIRQLADSLVQRKGGRTTGFVIGLEGQWGLGKSSIINLLKGHLEDRYPHALVLKFDPWLIHDRDKLIKSFFDQLIIELQEVYGAPPVWGCAQDQRNSNLAVALSAYSSIITGIADLAVDSADLSAPGLSGFLKVWVETARKKSENWLAKYRTIEAQRDRIMALLDTLPGPVVVLIDELDRVEDRDVRLMAALVKAIADFPQISYLLAYDRERVIEALGRTGTGTIDSNAIKTRGASYLEKIIQLPVSLPPYFDTDIQSRFNDFVEKQRRLLKLPWTSWEKERFEILQPIIFQALATERDFKRYLMLASARLAAVAEDVDWIDILGWTLLESQDGTGAAYIRENYAKFSSDIFSPSLVSYMVERNEAKKEGVSPQDLRFRKLEANSVLQFPWEKNLILLLFPSFGGKDANRTDGPLIAFKVPFFSLCQWSMAQTEISKSDLREFISLGSEEMRLKCKELVQTEKLPAYIESLLTFYSREVSNHTSLWVHLISSLDQEQSDNWEHSFRLREGLRQSVDSLFAIAKVNLKLRDELPQIFYELISLSAYEAISAVYNRYFRTDRLDQRLHSDDGEPVIPEEISNEIFEKFAAEVVKKTTDPKFVKSRPSSILFYVLRDNKLLTEDFGRKFQEWSSKDPIFLDLFMAWNFLPNYMVDWSGVQVFFPDKESFSKELIERASQLRASESFLTIAYDRAIEELRPEKNISGSGFTDQVGE